MGGKSGGASAAPKPPKPPKAPPAPPTMVDAKAVASKSRMWGGRKNAENVRNTGGGGGVSTADAQRATKYLSSRNAKLRGDA